MLSILALGAFALLYCCIPRGKDRRFNEYDQLKMDILGEVKKKREKEAFEKRCESIILYENVEQKARKSFIIDREGNVEYIKFEEVK